MNNKIKIKPNYSNDKGKMGRHNLSFKTGAFRNRKNDKKLDRRKNKLKINKNKFDN